MEEKKKPESWKEGGPDICVLVGVPDLEETTRSSGVVGNSVS